MERALQGLAPGLTRCGLDIEEVLVHRHDLPRTLYPIEDGGTASDLRLPSPAASGTQYLPAAVAGARLNFGDRANGGAVLYRYCWLAQQAKPLRLSALQAAAA